MRPSWNSYFMSLARAAATRATCPRRRVGAVIVRDRAILSTGYNGAPSGAPHCDDAGCLMIEGHCQGTVHAEANAVAQAARNGVSVKGAYVYVTLKPCFGCLKLLASAGIEGVYFAEAYGGEYPRLIISVECLTEEVP